MFIISLNYIKPIEAVDTALAAHRVFLEKYYALNKFICSGGKNPRTGGIILCNAQNKQEVEAIIKEDPFYQKQIASYEMIEFIPTKWSELFKPFIQ